MGFAVIARWSPHGHGVSLVLMVFWIHSIFVALLRKT